jgi:hypothetical protein
MCSLAAAWEVELLWTQEHSKLSNWLVDGIAAVEADGSRMGESARHLGKLMNGK